MILKDLDRGALHDVWKCLKLMELDRGAFWGEFVTLLILKELHRGALGRICAFSCKCMETQELDRGALGSIFPDRNSRIAETADSKGVSRGAVRAQATSI